MREAFIITFALLFLKLLIYRQQTTHPSISLKKTSVAEISEKVTLFFRMEVNVMEQR